MPALTPELTWLAVVVLATALMWMPYVLNRIALNGVVRAMGALDEEEMRHDRWALRAKAAHANAVENLVIFAPAVILCAFAGVSTPVTLVAVEAYAAARIAHYFIYLAGRPVLRTLTFAVGWAAQIVLLASALHLI